jgi:predicted DNA-binding protein
MSANDVRKNFVFKKEVAEHLESIAKKDGKSMTMVVQELIENKYNEISKEEKLDALYSFAKSMQNIPKEYQGMSIQEIKSHRGNKGERYGD